MNFQGIDPWSILGNQTNVERAVIPVESTLEDLRVEILDEESNKGRFGWLCMEQNHYIPYIYRHGSEPYVSVKMLEKKVLKRYLEVLPVDIPSCTSIRSFYMTDTEARLLNDINIIHCDGIFGKEIFTNQDLVVTLEDVEEFHQFLVLCHKKLVMKKSRSSDRCGFFRMTDSEESILPYIVKNEVKLVPIFYLEGETKLLNHMITDVKGWDLPYLKFCFKVQGVKSSLYSGDNLLVVNIQDIKTQFSAGVTFEEYWPDKGRIEAVSPYRRGVGSALEKWIQRPLNMIQQTEIEIHTGDGGHMQIQSGDGGQLQVQQDSGEHWQIQPGDNAHLQIEPMNWERLQMYLRDGAHLQIQSGD